MKPEGAVSCLVDQLLVDIYGLPYGDRGRSESDSTASSLRTRPPQHQHLQKARLMWKSKCNSIRDRNVCNVGEKGCGGRGRLINAFGSGTFIIKTAERGNVESVPFNFKLRGK